MRAFQSGNELREYIPSDVDLSNFRTVLGVGDDNPDFMIVKKQPNMYDMSAFKPFMGVEGLAIRRAVAQAGHKAYYTTVFPFAHPTEAVNLKLAREAGGAFREECERIGVKKFLLMGVETAKLHPDFQYEFTKLSEILHRNIISGDKTFRVVHHPGLVANNPAMFRDFIQAMAELKQGERKPRAKQPKQEGYLVVTDAKQAIQILRRMGERVAVDLETTGLDPYTCRVLTINISWVEGRGYAFPFDLLEADEWGEFFRGKKLLFQNGTYDVKVLAVNGVFVTISEDAMLMHSLIDETPGGHSLEVMAQKYLNVDKWTDLVDYKNMAEVDLEALGRYGARDTDLTLRLCNLFREHVGNTVIHQVLHRAQNSVTRSELRGVKVDREKAQQFADEIEKALHDRSEYIADTYGLANPNSPKQVARLLYDDIGLPVQREKGRVSTGSKALEGIKDAHPVIADIFEYRHLTKAGGTYVRNILAKSALDGRYHPEFRLASTETGRLSEPLILLIPRPDSLKNPDLGKQYQVRLRELFIPDEGYLMIGADLIDRSLSR